MKYIGKQNEIFLGTVSNLEEVKEKEMLKKRGLKSSEFEIGYLESETKKGQLDLTAVRKPKKAKKVK